MDHELVGVLDLPYTFFIFPIFSKFKTFLTLKKKKSPIKITISEHIWIHRTDSIHFKNDYGRATFSTSRKLILGFRDCSSQPQGRK